MNKMKHILLSHADFSLFQYEPAQHVIPCKLKVKRQEWKDISILRGITQINKQDINVPATQRRRKNWIRYTVQYAKKP